jgi:hypothetical protein
MARRDDDPRAHLKRIQRQLARGGRPKLKPASKLARLYDDLRDQAVADWAESQRKRALDGLEPEAPAAVRERQEVERISASDFLDVLADQGEAISGALTSAMLDPEVAELYRPWVENAEHPVLAFEAVISQPFEAWTGDIVLGDPPDPNRLKAYLLQHAIELRATLEERPAKELAAELSAILAEPEYEPKRGPSMLAPGQWRGLPSGIGKDPGTYSVFLAPDDKRFWAYAKRVRSREQRRARDRQKVFDKALAEIRSKGGDERRAIFWVRVHNRMMQLADRLARKRRKHKREYFGGMSRAGTYHAGHRRKRKRR